MAALEPAAVAVLLVELGRRTALAGDNYFRAKAYLRAADTLSAREDRLKTVNRLGAAVQRKILEGLKIRETTLGARHLHRADKLANSAAETLERSRPGLIRTVTAGDLRRGGEVVSNLALVAEVERLAGPPKVITSGEMSVYLTDARRFGVSLLFATGSSKHLESLQQRAADRGMTLTPEGLRRGRKIIAAETEAEIYEALGLQFIEPELREGLDEILCAAAHKIPSLVTGADLLGVLHAHPTASDGADTLEAMAEAS